MPPKANMASLMGEIGYTTIPADGTAFWQTMTASSGYVLPFLIKEDVEDLAQQWLDQGAGNLHWEHRKKNKIPT